MSQAYSLLFAFSLTILPALHAEKIDNRNCAIDTCFPTPNEIQLAEGTNEGILGETFVTLWSRTQVFGRRDFEDFPGRGSKPLAKTDKL